MLKKFSLFLVLAIGLTGFSSFSSTDTDTIVTVKKGHLLINGVDITSDWSLAKCKKALGEPDRTRDGYNKTHTYDKKSIVLFEPMEDKKPSGRVSEVQVYFHVAEANNVTPNGDGFSGTAKVDKLKVTIGLGATEMLSTLKKWKKTDSYIENSYRMASKGLYIYFQFNQSETSMVKISIGPDKRTK